MTQLLKKLLAVLRAIVQIALHYYTDDTTPIKVTSTGSTVAVKNRKEKGRSCLADPVHRTLRRYEKGTSEILFTAKPDGSLHDSSFEVESNLLTTTLSTINKL